MKQTFSSSSFKQYQPFTRCISQQVLTPLPPNPEIQLIQERLYVSKSNLNHELSQYQWRIDTEFPIVKIVNFNTQKVSEDKTAFDIKYEYNPYTLAELKDLPLFKIIYLMKQVLVACERLYNRYGPFLLNSRMIVITQQFTCRTWINQNLASNMCTSLKINEQGFLSILFNIFQEKNIKLKNNMIFFEQLKKQHTFYEAMNYLEYYCRINKIVMPRIIRITDKQILTIRSSKKCFNANMTMNKTPKFLNNKDLRSSLTHQQSKIIISVLPPQTNESELPQKPMKMSGDTTVEGDGEGIVQSIIVNNSEKEKEEKSSLKKKGIIRKFSMPAEDPYNNFWKKKHYTANKYLTISSAQQLPKQESEVDIRLMFSQNNWSQTINGLFENDSTLRKSFHKGKDERKQDFTIKELNLLGSMGNTLKESFISEDMDN